MKEDHGKKEKILPKQEENQKNIIETNNGNVLI